MKIVITGASSGIGRALENQFTLFGHTIIPIDRSHGFDLSTFQGIDSALDSVEEKRPIDVWINNAGVMLFEDGLYWNEGVEMVNVNLMALWYAMKHTPVRNGGNIINIASIAGICNDADTALYSATKAGVISLTKAYAKEYAKNEIRVNCISPGLLATNLVEEETPEELIAKVPLKYEESPVALFGVVQMILMSPYMTGSNIVFDGGLSL